MEDIQKAIWYLKKIEELNCEGADDMPYENEKHDVKFGFIGEDGKLHEIPWVTSFEGTFKVEPEKDKDDVEKAYERITETIHDRYLAFINAGFEKNQAFALTRDWWQRELKGYSNHDNA